MKAPEKIYRTTTYLDNDKGKTVWKNAPVAGAENIKYIRTDAFIGKACEWIEHNNKNGGCSFDGWRKDFIKFLESE